jgi:transcription initiation factor TFIIIB Brf1 subunit/transcription initiation factor TFIIB
LCREVSTPEGLRVCADTGEVVGVEMEPAERVFDDVLPRYAPLSPSSHNLLEPVALEWRRDGRPRGFGPGGVVALEARKARRGLRGRFAGYEAVAVRAFRLLRQLAGAVGAPRVAVEEASAVLRRLLSGGGGGLLVRAGLECAVAGALVAAMEARGFHYSPSEVAGAAGVEWKCMADAARHLELRRLAPRRTAVLPMRERVAGHVARIASGLGLGREVAELAMRIYDEYVRVHGPRLPSLPENAAAGLVHLVARILGCEDTVAEKAVAKACRRLAEGLVIVVRA